MNPLTHLPTPLLRRLRRPTRRLPFLIACLAAGTSSALAEWTAPDSYTNSPPPVVLGSLPGYGVDPSDDTDDDSEAFRGTIEHVHLTGGGKINVPSGTYRFRNVHLKSDVHLVFQSDCILYPYTDDLDTVDDADKDVIMLHLGRNEAISDVSIRSVGPVTTVFKLEGFFNKLQAIACADVENFEIRRLQFDDTKTWKAAVGLSWRQSSSNGSTSNPDRIPIDGSLRWLKSTNAHYGFGTIQANAGQDINFLGIESEGGVTLRLETDWIDMTLASYDNAQNINAGLSGITANNITVRDGQSAVKLWPHAIVNGDVTISGVYSYDSEYAIEIAGGSLHKFSESQIQQFKTYLGLTGQAADNWKGGSFSSVSIAHVNAWYTAGPIITQNAHIMQYHPDVHDWTLITSQDAQTATEYRLTASAVDEPKLSGYRGTSIAPILIKGEQQDNGYPFHPVVNVNHSFVHKYNYPSGVTNVWRDTDFYGNDCLPGYQATPQDVINNDPCPH